MSEFQEGTRVKFNPFYEDSRDSDLYAPAARFEVERSVIKVLASTEYFQVKLNNDRNYRRCELLIKGVDYE